MSKKVLVFGCGGQLGVELMRVFRNGGYTVTGFDRAGVDVTDAGKVEHTLAEIDPAIVVNAAAYNQVDLAEKDPASAYNGNALAVRNIALACRQIDARLIHFSTDYVFDGTLGRPYTEEDHTHPTGAYAVSKLAGELYAQAYLDNVLILRTSGVYGPAGLRTNRGNFVETMLRLAESGKPIRVVEDHIASPAYAPALAERTIECIEKNLTGVFHIGGGTPISWFHFAKLIFEEFGLRPSLTPTDEREYRTPAKRPKFSALSNAKIERAGITPMPGMPEAIAAYRAGREQVQQSA